MASPEEDRAEVRRALAEARRTSRVPLAFGGAVSDGHELRLTEMSGNTTESLRGLVVSAGRGLGGQAITSRRSVAVTDYLSSSSISHHFDHAVRAEGVRAALAVPVIVGRTVRAVLYAGAHEVVNFGSGTITHVAQAARELEQRLAIRDELNRWIASLKAAPGQSLPADSAERDAIRAGYAELRAISHQVADPALRTRIDAVCVSLTGGHAPARRDGKAPTLSQRELDVLTCVAAGQSNAETAAMLMIGPETVKSYLRSAMRKLDSHTRMQAVNAARHAGLLP